MRRKITLLAFLLWIINIAQPAAGQQPTYVGIAREQFNYLSSSQRNSQWCWAASLQMIFNYYGVRITQEQIVGRTYGTDPAGQLPNWSGSFGAITANLNNWNVDDNGTPYFVQASVNPGAPTPAYLLQELSNQHPVLIGYRSGPNAGHAVVITACSYTPSAYGPIIQSIVVRDPWPSQQNSQNLGRVEYTGVKSGQCHSGALVHSGFPVKAGSLLRANRPFEACSNGTKLALPVYLPRFPDYLRIHPVSLSDFSVQTSVVPVA